VGVEDGRPADRIRHRVAQPDRPHRGDASVDYGCATFLNIVLQNYGRPAGTGTLKQVFLLFVVILVLHALINVLRQSIINHLQNVSVWWHVFGAAVIVGILIFVPTTTRAPAGCSASG
jgi:hypothetical protein